MKKRQFLIPLTVLAAGMVANNASANTPTPSNAPNSNDSYTSNIVPDANATSFSEGSNLEFLVSRSESGQTVAWHTSHASHASHASHQSHYSGY